MSKVLAKTEEALRGLDEIETTAFSSDGESDVKFRIMVEKHPTNEETIILFNKIIKSIAQTSNHSDVWNYYNGYFEMKNYENGEIYKATKLIGEELDILSN